MDDLSSVHGSEYRELFNRWAEANGYPFIMEEPLKQRRRDWNPTQKPDNIKEVKVLGHESVIRGKKADLATLDEFREEWAKPGKWMHVDKTKLFNNKTLWRYFMGESKDKTQVNVNAEGDQLEIIHRHGAAAEIQEPRKVHITGSIEAPLEYYDKRKGVIDQDKAHLEVDQQHGSIRLFCDPHSPKGAEIVGNIKMNPLLERMKINDFTGSNFGEDDFILMLKQTRSLFTQQSDNLNLVDKIKNLEMKVNQEIDRKDDERGSRKDYFEQIAKTDLPESFDITTNIFVGSKEAMVEQTFSVELKYHYKGQLYLWLESAELQDIYEARLEKSLGEQINGFNEEIPIIYI